MKKLNIIIVVILFFYGFNVFSQENIKNRNQFETFKIDNQIWMSENLDIEIENSKYYQFNNKKHHSYGRLYTWEAAMQVCPTGWHLPSKEEFKTMLKNIKKINKNKYEQITKDDRFDAKLGGFVFAGSSRNINYEGYYWTSSVIKGGGAWCLKLNKASKSVKIIGAQQSMSYSVRCIKNID